MKRIAPPPAKPLPRMWDEKEWTPIKGRPGWFENKHRPNPDGSYPKAYRATIL